MTQQIRRTASFVLAFCAAGSLAAQAGELRRDRIPAATDWVLHVDMEAVVGSGLYRQAEVVGLLSGRYKSDYRDDFLSELDLEGADEFERVLLLHDFDPFEDFKSLTLFGELAAPNSAVVVFDFGPKAAEILADLRAQPEHLSVEHDGLKFDAWLEDGNEVNGYLFALPADEDGAMTIAVCEERDPLLDAARVLMGESASLAGVAQAGDGGLLAQPAAGSFVYVEVAGSIPGVEESDPASRIFSSARALRFDVGEQEGQFLAQLTLETDRPDEARRVAQVVQGVVALAALAASDSPESQAFAEIADGVNVTARDAELIADFEMSSSRMVQLAAEHRDRRRAEREARANRTR
ncbi:MAG: hypothetical protein H6831_12135 [Planctomycetes bacterium]|nr:hypothetical protein [Planctomycetota bacterium]MCB9905151.1 hypothetical protein [Planctomycetota bacterium]